MADENQYTAVDERPKRKKGWLVPLIILLLLIALGLLLYNKLKNDKNDNSTSQTSTSQSAQQQDTDQQQQSITDLNAVLNPANPADIIGKKVALQDAPILTVFGDKSFTVGTSDKKVYALLSDQLNSGQEEQIVQVKDGEKRAVNGTVKKAPADAQTLTQQFQLSQQQADELLKQGYYVEVDNTNQQ